jgi:RNA recognition motif-containing protein
MSTKIKNLFSGLKMDRMCVSDEKELPHIIVENLSYFCSENALLEHFNAEYPIKSVSMRVKYKNDGDSYPHSATVTLKNPEHEDFMLERFHGTLFMGKFLM